MDPVEEIKIEEASYVYEVPKNPPPPSSNYAGLDDDFLFNNSNNKPVNNDFGFVGQPVQGLPVQTDFSNFNNPIVSNPSSVVFSAPNTFQGGFSQPQNPTDPRAINLQNNQNKFNKAIQERMNFERQKKNQTRQAAIEYKKNELEKRRKQIQNRKRENKELNEIK